jgi:hypothetical protein
MVTEMALLWHGRRSTFDEEGVTPPSTYFAWAGISYPNGLPK